MKAKKCAGFTLIEMLVVLIIITALVLIFVPNLLQQSNKAKHQSDQAFQQVIDNQGYCMKATIQERNQRIGMI